MIRRSTTDVLLEPNLYGSLITTLRRSIGKHCPIAIRSDRIAKDSESGRDKDMINTARSQQFGIKGIERPIGSKAMLCERITILQERGRSEARINLVCLIYIEVPREDDRRRYPSQRLDLAQDKMRRSKTCDLPHVIEMQIEEEETALRRQIFELYPGADPHAGSIPAKRRTLRGLT